MTSKVDPEYPLKVERLPDGKRKLIDTLKVGGFRTVFPNSQLKVKHGTISQGAISINAGFVMDYSSVPTLFQWFVRWSKVDVAGVVHDFLYNNTNFPRKEADDIWYELAQSGDHCANCFQAWVCWLMLRGFGGFCEPRPGEYKVMATLWALSVGLILLSPAIIAGGLLACWVLGRLAAMAASICGLCSLLLR